MSNNSGKTITILIVLLTIILISSTSIGFYLYHRERDKNKQTQAQLEEIQQAQTKSLTEIDDLKKQVVILSDKNKEADEKINNLLDEIELNEGLRKELKKENDSLKNQADAFNKNQQKAKTDLDEANKKAKDLADQLDVEKNRANALAKQLTEMQQKINTSNTPQSPADAPKIELNKIVVNPNDSGLKGRIVTVEKDSDFVVINLGAKQGIKAGDVLSVYRGEEYLGDVKATRVQEQLSAADLIPPFSSNKVRKNDIVMIKPE